MMLTLSRSTPTNSILSTSNAFKRIFTYFISTLFHFYIQSSSINNLRQGNSSHSNESNTSSPGVVSKPGVISYIPNIFLIPPTNVYYFDEALLSSYPFLSIKTAFNSVSS